MRVDVPDPSTPSVPPSGGPAGAVPGEPTSTDAPADRLEAAFAAMLELLGPERCSRQATERRVYSRDLWPLQLMRMRADKLPPLPGMVIWPETEAEVLEAISIARRFRLPLTPYGGGSGVLGGAMPSPGGIVLDLKRMDQPFELDPVCCTCTVGPGILGQHLEDRLNQRGFTLGHFPSSLMTASVGGYIVTRSAGQLSSRYGKIEDMAVSMRMVTGAGTLLDTSSESLSPGGLDVNQVLMGSEGTLGVVTRVTLKIHPMARSSAYRGIRFPTLESGLHAMRDIMQAGLRPSVLRLYDEIDTFLVGRGESPETHQASAIQARQTKTRKPAGPLKSALKAARHSVMERFPSVARSAVRTALGRPALLERITHRLLPDEVLLILGSEGEPEEVEATMASCIERCQAQGGVDLGSEPGERWYQRRYEVSFKMPTFFHLGAFVDTVEVAATWERIPDLYHAVRAAATEDVAIMAHFSHAYSDGVSIYFSLAGAAEDAETAEARYHRAWEHVLQTVAAFDATVSHHHGVGKMKAVFVARENQSWLALYGRLKSRLDPDGILNPGKLYLQAEPSPSNPAQPPA